MNSRIPISKIHPKENVGVALDNLSEGHTVEFDSSTFRLVDNIPLKHKFASIKFHQNDPDKAGATVLSLGCQHSEISIFKEALTDLQKGIFSELTSGANIDLYRRGLQRAYIERLEYLLTQDQSASSGEPTRINTSQSDIRPMARLALTNLQSEIKRALPKYGNTILKAHLVDVLARIDDILNPKK